MGRCLRSSIPTSAQALAPNWPDLNKFREVDERYKQKFKRQHDRHHRVRELPVLDDQVPVYISIVEGAHLPFQAVLFGQQGNNHMKFQHEQDCPDVTEVRPVDDETLMTNIRHSAH